MNLGMDLNPAAVTKACLDGRVAFLAEFMSPVNFCTSVDHLIDRASNIRFCQSWLRGLLADITMNM